MAITSENLPRHLASELKTLYVVYGDSELLAIEAADNIRRAAQSAGYSEREIFTVDQHFKWDELLVSAQSLSLFTNRKVIDLRIPSGKPGLEGGQVLQEYCDHLGEGTLTLITLPRLDKSSQSSKWFGSLQQHGVMVFADDIPVNAMPGWISGRLKRQEQNTDKATLDFLANRCEGNLLAAFQEIQKLALLYPAGLLTFDQVKEAVMDVSRYDVYKLTEAMLNANAARYTRILDGLRAEGTATVLVLWAISEELRILGKVLQATLHGKPIKNAMQEARIWGSRQNQVEAAVRRLNLPRIERGLLQASRLDRVIKGLGKGDVWDELLQLGLRFCKP